MISEQRFSGAELNWPCVVKIGKDETILRQARIMERRKDVYCPFSVSGLDNGNYFYVMPLYDDYKKEMSVAAAKQAIWKLQNLWGGSTTLRRIDPYRAAYQEYVDNLEMPSFLRAVCRNLYDKTRTVEGTRAEEVHGDATLGNIVHSEEASWWIDPNPRIVPLEVELDLGKILQSLYGYEEHRASQPVNDLFCKLVGEYIETEALQMYYLATHVARLWKYQIHKAEWVTDVAAELENYDANIACV